MRPGLTLLELLVVMVLIVTAAAVAVPAVRRDIVPGDVEAAASEVDQLIRRANRISTARGIRLRVTIDPPTRRFWLMTDAGIVLESGQLAADRAVSVASDVARPQVRIRTDGIATSDPFVISGGGEHVRITIDPLMRQARLEFGR